MGVLDGESNIEMQFRAHAWVLSAPAPHPLQSDKLVLNLNRVIYRRVYDWKAPTALEPRAGRRLGSEDSSGPRGFGVSGDLSVRGGCLTSGPSSLPMVASILLGVDVQIPNQDNVNSAPGVGVQDCCVGSNRG